MAATCGYEAELEKIMRDVFAIGLQSGLLRDRVFEEDASKSNCTMPSVLNIALTKEAALLERGKTAEEIEFSEMLHLPSNSKTRNANQPKCQG